MELALLQVNALVTLVTTPTTTAQTLAQVVQALPHATMATVIAVPLVMLPTPTVSQMDQDVPVPQVTLVIPHLVAPVVSLLIAQIVIQATLLPAMPQGSALATLDTIQMMTALKPVPIVQAQPTAMLVPVNVAQLARVQTLNVWLMALAVSA